jgi:hypothetical protein
MKTATDSLLNQHYGPWIEVKKSFPWSLFFTYRQMKHGKSIYYDRQNKLDRFFTKICETLSK